MNMCQKTFVVPSSSQTVQLSVSKERVQPQPFDKSADVAPNENTAKLQGRHWRGQTSDSCSDWDVASRYNKQRNEEERSVTKTIMQKNFKGFIQIE